jgi:putative membrane protein
MKGQWNLILALTFALIVAVFSVINVEPVKVRYLFGEAYIPLIIVILGSTLAGGLIVGTMGLFRQYKLHREIKALRKAVDTKLTAEEIKVIDTEVNETLYNDTTEEQSVGISEEQTKQLSIDKDKELAPTEEELSQDHNKN